MFEDRVRRFHGDSMLWCGVDPSFMGLVERCMVRHRFQLFQPGGPVAQSGQLPGRTAAVPQPRSPERDTPSFCSALAHIPLANHQLDGVVLHHALDISQDPRSAIREVARVIAPGGRLLISGLNPISLTGLRCGIGRLTRDPMRHTKLILPSRLLDWLSVLGFSLESQVAYLAYRPPWGHQFFERPSVTRVRRWLRRSRTPFGGVYVVEARKQAVGARPIWQKKRLATGKLAPVAYPKLTARSRS